MTVYTKWINFDDWTTPIERLTEVYRVVGPLEGVLHEAFLDTQARVASPAHPHVPTYMPTGRLANSGHTHSELIGTDNWVGEIIYDARNDRGDAYAIYEFNRGGQHDAMAGLPFFHEEYEEVLRRFFEGSE